MNIATRSPCVCKVQLSHNIIMNLINAINYLNPQVFHSHTQYISSGVASVLCLKLMSKENNRSW